MGLPALKRAAHFKTDRVANRVVTYAHACSMQSWNSLRSLEIELRSLRIPKLHANLGNIENV